MIIITSKQPGFRRCGVAHPAEPTEYEDGFFTQEQIAALHDEPMLVVLEVEDVIGDNPPGKLSAAEAIAIAKAATTIEELDVLTKGETRKTVLDAIVARHKELI